MPERSNDPRVRTTSGIAGGTMASDSVLLEALEQAPDAILICDRSGVIEYVNASIVDMLGYEREQLVGEAVEILIPDRLRDAHEAHRFDYDENPSPRPMGLGLRLSARHADGHDVAVEISLSPVTDATDGRVIGVIGVIRDVGERRRLLEQIADAHARLAIAEDRDRIARDLHDTVIQRLFATGLSLQAAIGRADIDERIDRAVVSIDDAIRDLRTSIFSLRRPIDALSVGDSVRSTIDEARRMLDCPLDVRIGSELDYRVPGSLRPDLVAVVRESLTNVVKHAAARRVGVEVGVEVGVDGEQIVVRVDDDGVGFVEQTNSGGQGLRNLRERAAQMGGRCHVRSSIGAGTHIVFSIPLPS